MLDYILQIKLTYLGATTENHEDNLITNLYHFSLKLANTQRNLKSTTGKLMICRSKDNTWTKVLIDFFAENARASHQYIVMCVTSYKLLSCLQWNPRQVQPSNVQPSNIKPPNVQPSNVPVTISFFLINCNLLWSLNKNNWKMLQCELSLFFIWQDLFAQGVKMIIGSVILITSSLEIRDSYSYFPQYLGLPARLIKGV